MRMNGRSNRYLAWQAYCSTLQWWYGIVENKQSQPRIRLPYDKRCRYISSMAFCLTEVFFHCAHKLIFVPCWYSFSWFFLFCDDVVICGEYVDGFFFCFVSSYSVTFETINPDIIKLSWLALVKIKTNRRRQSYQFPSKIGKKKEEKKKKIKHEWTEKSSEPT